MSKMKIKGKEIDFTEFIKSVICIGIGTAIGLYVYWLFYVNHIAILGYNLALIFAPIIAGLIETVLANKLLGRNLGAISAIILFVDTTFHSFILKNPSLGMNFITAGTIVVILQAAFPTVINYLIIVALSASISNFKWIRNTIRNIFKNPDPEETPVGEIEQKYFDEKESNRKINDLGFIFMTSTDMIDKEYDIIDIFHSEIFLENRESINVKQFDVIENNRLVAIKEGKDECLIRLANKIMENGGNAILDLDIQYGMVGPGGDHLHITATGMGIYLR